MSECKVLVTIESPWDRAGIERDLDRFMAEHDYINITKTADGGEHQVTYEEVVAAGDCTPEQILAMAD